MGREFRGGGVKNILGQLTSPSTYPTLVPLWFVRNLMVAVLLAPLLCWLLRKRWGWVSLLILIGCYVCAVQVPVYGLESMFFITVTFFAAGAWCSLHHIHFASLAARHAVWTVPLWLLLGAACIRLGRAFPEGLLLYTLHLTIGVAAVVGITARHSNPARPMRGILGYAAANTFFIYVAHCVVINGNVQKVAAHLPLPAAVRYLAVPFVVVATCLIVLYPLQRYFPRLAAILTGERVSGRN